MVTKLPQSLCQKSILLVVISLSGLHPALCRLIIFRQPRWGGQAALNLASACNNAIKVMHYTRHFWYGVRCALLVQRWHTLLRALCFYGDPVTLRSTNFYLVNFIMCSVLAIIVKAIRTNYYGINDLIDVLLGSSPSFLYLFGLIAFIPLVKRDIEPLKFKKYTLLITVGALTYEAEQYWTARIFDLNDVMATLLATSLMLLVHRRKSET